MANVVNVIITASNRVGAGLNAVRTRFSQFLANMRVAWNRNFNNFINQGGFPGLMRRLPGMFANAGQQAGQFFMNNFKSIALGLAGSVGIAIAATLAGALVAALGSAVLLAVGGGVFAAGIAAAAKSAPVKSAFDGFRDRAKNAFKDIGGPFQAPLVRAMQAFGDTAERVAPSIQKMVAMAAPHLDALVLGFTQMAERIIPGLEKALEASLPLFDKLAEKMPSIGTAISQFFELIADAGPELQRVLTFLIDALNVVIVVLGGTINFAAKFYAKMIGFWKGVGEVAVNVWNAISNAAIATWGFITSAASKAWSFMVSAFQAAKSVIISAFGALTSAILGFVGMIVNAAAKAFGWIPGIGPKLQQAAAEFNNFAARVNAAINGIQKTVTITVRARVVGGSLLTAAQQSGEYSSGIGGRAAGGVASGLTKVGERGWELVDFNQRRVYNHEQSRRMERQMGGGGTAVVVQGFVGTGAGAAVAELLNKLVRNGDIQWRAGTSAVTVA